MKINTDLVIGKQYSTAIEPQLLKHSQEYRVLATLRYLYPSKFDNLIIGEAPDLQDCANSIGIEVTAAVQNNDMRASRALSELLRTDTKNVKKRKKSIEASGYTIVPLPGNKIAISTTGTADEEKKCFQESIRRKTKKLKQYQTKFRQLGLAILLPEIPTSYAESKLTNWLAELTSESGNSFDFVYVISHRFCMYCDFTGNIIEKYPLSDTESICLAKIGRMTAEGQLKLTDSEEWM